MIGFMTSAESIPQTLRATGTPAGFLLPKKTRSPITIRIRAKPAAIIMTWLRERDSFGMFGRLGSVAISLILHDNDRRQPVARLDVHDPHALGGAAGQAHALQAGADDLPFLGEGEKLLFRNNHPPGDDAAGFGSHVRGADAGTAAVLDLVFLKRRLLAETVGHDDKEMRLLGGSLTDQVEAGYPVAAPELDRPDAGGGPAHR